MPITTLILPGMPQLMATEDEVFALPARRTLGFVSPADAVLEISDAVGGTFVVLTVEAVTGKFETAAPFIRNGGATDCSVRLVDGGG